VADPAAESGTRSSLGSGHIAAFELLGGSGRPGRQPRREPSAVLPYHRAMSIIYV
jgi:hypothetical protein